MKRITVKLDGDQISALDRLSEELNKGDVSLTEAAKRNKTIIWLLDSVPEAHKTIVEQKNKVTIMESHHKAQSEDMASTIKALEDKLVAYQSKYESEESYSKSLECVVSCFKKTIHHLSGD